MNSILVPLVRERGRVLAPAVLICLVGFIVAAHPLGIRPATPAYIAIWSTVGVLAVLTAVRNRVSDRWIHVVSAAVLWCPILATMIGMYSTGSTAFGLLLVLGVLGAGTLLNTRMVIATLIGTNLVGISLLARTDGPFIGMFIAAIVTTSAFALLIHVLVQSALVRAETHRLAAADSAKKLERQLVNLERAHVEHGELQNQLLHAQRMEAVGTLAAGIAHDMNNVLASITSFTELAIEQTTSTEVRADLGQVVKQAERGAALTRGLLAFSHKGQYRKRVVRIDEVIREVVPLLGHTMPKSIEIRNMLDVGDACVEGDPVHLVQALVNFGLNAADAMAGTGTLVIKAELVDIAHNALGLAPGKYAWLRVTDTGKGMDAATQLRVFEPFFTTKPLGEGTGLGLSVVWGIARAHGGAVTVDSAVGHGSTFSMYLPIVAGSAAAHMTQKLERVTPRKTTVLVVDDEPALRESTARVLSRMGLDALVAANGLEALQVLSQHAGEIELVILDMGMPVMGGTECFRKIRETSDVPVLVATGYAVDADAQELVRGGASIIEKPYASKELKREVTRLLQRN
jgi:two-component system cell cycle sensor histidine kinase/response regulator CckA